MTARDGKDCRAERMLTVRKTLSILTAFLLLTTPAWAMRTPVLGGSTSAPSTSATNYGGFRSSFVGTNDQNVRAISSLPGLFEGMYASVVTAPDTGGGTQSWTMTLQLNGADTEIACTISEAQTSCEDITHTITVAAGDNFSIKVVPSGTPASALLRYGTIFNSGTGGASLVYSSANGANANTGSNETINIQGNLAWGQSNLVSQMPTNGTFSKLYVLAKSAPGAAASGKSYTFTIQKNSVDTALTCTMTETATICNDTSNSFSVVAGDAIRLKSAPSNTPTSDKQVIGLAFTPTVDGESLYMQANQNAYSASVDTFIAIQGYASTNTTEATTLIAVSPYDVIAKKLYISNSTTSPGAAKSVANYLRLNAVNSALTCTRTGASAPTCQDTTNNVSVQKGTTLNFVHSPSGTPSIGSSSRFSVVLYIDPVDTIYDSTLY